MDMVMSWVFVIMLVGAVLSALLTGNGSQLATAIPVGAQTGVTLVISLAGSLCLWSGVGRLMESTGASAKLSQWLMPVIGKLFPTAKKDRHFASCLSGNICANILGLGNAATPLGIEAAKALAGGKDIAGKELCRLIVLNTASVQLIPATVGAIRANLGASSPFDILPAVWITSICSVSMGLIAAFLLEKLWRK